MRKTSNYPREVNGSHVDLGWATELLIKSQIFLNRETIYDPCCGKGNILNAFYKMDEKDRPHIIKGTDLIDRGFINQDPRYPFYTVDFLQSPPDKKMVGSIVFNPPYKHAKKCIEKALQYGEYPVRVIALLPLHFFTSQTEAWFERNHFAKLLVFSKRHFMPDIFDYGWFVFFRTSFANGKIEWI